MSSERSLPEDYDWQTDWFRIPGQPGAVRIVGQSGRAFDAAAALEADGWQRVSDEDVRDGLA